MTAYLSSPEMSLAFAFEFEDTEQVAQIVQNFIEDREVSVFKFVDLDGNAGPHRIMVNWASLITVVVTDKVPPREEIEASNRILYRAFIDKDGTISTYEDLPD